MDRSLFKESQMAARMAPGASRYLYDRARFLGLPDRARHLVEMRCWGILRRLAPRLKTPLSEAAVRAIVEKCIARVEKELLTRVRGLDPTMDEATARKILELPPSGETTKVRNSLCAA
jgi:hypothetical protein